MEVEVYTASNVGILIAEFPEDPRMTTHKPRKLIGIDWSWFGYAGVVEMQVVGGKDT